MILLRNQFQGHGSPIHGRINDKCCDWAKDFVQWDLYKRVRIDGQEVFHEWHIVFMDKEGKNAGEISSRNARCPQCGTSIKKENEVLTNGDLDTLIDSLVDVHTLKRVDDYLEQYRRKRDEN